MSEKERERREEKKNRRVGKANAFTIVSHIGKIATDTYSAVANLNV
jgi:hypothetical protein